MAGVITAAEPSWISPFTGLRLGDFRKLVTLCAERAPIGLAEGVPGHCRWRTGCSWSLHTGGPT